MNMVSSDSDNYHDLGKSAGSGTLSGMTRRVDDVLTSGSRAVAYLYASPLVYRNHANLPNVPHLPAQLSIEGPWRSLSLFQHFFL